MSITNTTSTTSTTSRKRSSNAGCCEREIKIHTLALAIAVLGPLLNFWIKPFYAPLTVNPYVYWSVALGIYIAILLPFIKKLPKSSQPSFTLVRLVVLGITIEDFCSNLWESVFTGTKFLPFCNWYAQYFPFLEALGQPTPYVLIPQWYVLAVFAYIALTFLQYRRRPQKTHREIRRRKK